MRANKLIFKRNKKNKDDFLFKNCFMYIALIKIKKLKNILKFLCRVLIFYRQILFQNLISVFKCYG